MSVEIYRRLTYASIINTYMRTYTHHHHQRRRHY